MTWQSDAPPPQVAIPLRAWPRLLARALALVLAFASGLLVHALARLIERPLAGARRPVSGRVVQAVCRAVLVVLGLRLRIHGEPMPGAGALVANHTSWLDILVLHAVTPVTFVSKAEVAGWPGIGLLARVTGTLFIRRDRREARAQATLFAARLEAGQRLLFFPEGTSSDGLQVLPFKPALFEALLAPALRARLHLQPVSLSYHAPDGADWRFYGWWGDMDFGHHALGVLAQRPQGSVTLRFHPPLAIADQTDRKALAATAEAAVRAGVCRADT